MIRSSEACALAIRIATWQYGEVQYNNVYPGNILSWFPGLNAWQSDCLGFVRAPICGWHGDKTVPAGGANTSYQCYQFNEPQMLNTCTQTSSNFAQLNTPLCLLYMSGHVGLYVGEFYSGGHTYNVCECTTGFRGGALPSWVDADGTRREYQGSNITRGRWEQWGVFDTSGRYYEAIQYDGGAPAGITGFGVALSAQEVTYYWNSLPTLTYSYVATIARNVHGMSADFFRVFAGWGWGEAYANEHPIGWNHPDYYMAYLCDCCCVNALHQLHITTGQRLANWCGSGNPDTPSVIAYYSYSNMTSRGQQLEQQENTAAGQNELRALLLAILNPNQLAQYCNGVSTGGTVIYQNNYQNEGVIYSFYYTQMPYATSGSGIRGGLPDPNVQYYTSMKIPLYLRNRNYFSQRRRYRR